MRKPQVNAADGKRSLEKWVEGNAPSGETVKVGKRKTAKPRKGDAPVTFERVRTIHQQRREVIQMNVHITAELAQAVKMRATQEGYARTSHYVEEVLRKAIGEAAK